MPKRRPMEDRFFDKVIKKPGCWAWGGHINEHGYGRMLSSEPRTLILAHRASWVIHCGPIPSGLLVLHRCDNPGCTKPSHLYIGTQSDNMRDRALRTWRPIGEKHPRTHLKDSDIAKIRKLHREGNPPKDIATVFCITRTAVYDITQRRCWSHIQ